MEALGTDDPALRPVGGKVLLRCGEKIDRPREGVLEPSSSWEMPWLYEHQVVALGDAAQKALPDVEVGSRVILAVHKGDSVWATRRDDGTWMLNMVGLGERYVFARQADDIVAAIE